ncbi:uncharacterized protein LOC131234303 isoform X2 [Magnolia sinica]|uniref:uncharacterized protein LOC131234303 isoform X2 n=1 Tax=Magnolia sinica TaxID=86752 RepID=UPI0026592596|nr:uncharacterized protein LOC131234303 isoform X2 [Magnolia sinica]
MGGGRGGQKRGRTQRRHFRQNRENVWKKSRALPSDNDNNSNSNNTSNNPDWQPFATQNLAFEEYYKEQEIVPVEEWEEFLHVLRKPLPAAFRINSSQFFKDIRSQLENDFMKSLESEVTDDNELEAIRPLPWYPENLAWHLNFSRMQLRKNQTLERFHEFLKQENEIGNITRQEAVSMVPPLFLDVRPDHCVLDMCAAPGSKTFQLLEIIHQSTEPGSLPDGLIIANDVDVQRCNLLIHQTKRMCSANLIVTNHEAQHFPSCSVNGNFLDKGSIDGGLASPQSNGAEEPNKRQLLFDRVLCDVPCSGDGTLRKAPDIWRKWNAGMGNGVHRLQVQIAMRGIALLKVGGRMVYSTCSMNPVENEAVVAEVLRRSGDAVELLDVSAELPQLVRRPGLRQWKVRDKGLWLTSYKDVPKYRRTGIVPSMFPSGESCVVEERVSDDLENEMGKPEIESETGNLTDLKGSHQNGSNHMTTTDGGETVIELVQPPNSTAVQSSDTDCKGEVSVLPLEHCMRILPHDQNSGAFFIAVLHKLSPLQENPISKCSKKGTLLPKKLSDDIIEDMPEISSSKDGPSQNLVSAEAASNADLLDKQTSIMPMEISLEVDANENTTKENKLEAKACENRESDLERPKGEKGKSQIQGKWRGVDPVVFFRDDTIINSIRNFYGVSESFPFDGHLVTRNSDVHHVKRIYYVSKSVRDALKLNFQVGQQLKITSLGLKIFERQTSKEGPSQIAYRISSEGLPLLLPYISKQILSVSYADFEHLLRYRIIKFADFVDAAFGEKASKLMLGCCIVVLNTGDQYSPETIVLDASTIAIGCWKGKTNLSVMVSQTDSQELLERLSVRLGKDKVSLAQADGCDSSEPVMAVDENANDADLIEDFETAEQEVS